MNTYLPNRRIANWRNSPRHSWFSVHDVVVGWPHVVLPSHQRDPQLALAFAFLFLFPELVEDSSP